MSRFFRFIAFCSLVFTGSWALAQQENQYLRFTVMAMAPDLETRAAFEDGLVAVLQEDDYDAVASHTLVPVINPVQSTEVRQALLENGIQAVLVLRPLATGNDASITAAQEALGGPAYNRLSDFIQSYRGDDFNSQAVVQVVGYLLDPQQSRLFWQGVIWLDETVNTRQEAISKLVTLVQFNLNQSRAALRRQLGLSPLQLGQ